MCIQWWSSYLLLQRKFACNLIVIVVLTVLNEIKRRQSTSLVEAAWYFSIKKSPCFTAHRYYHLHRRVINRSSNRRDFCLYALFLTSRTHKRIEHSSLLSPSHFSSCQTFISYINWTLLVPSTRKWRRAYIYTYTLLRQILYHDCSLSGLLHNG